jgi:hypothetical protein
VLQTYGYYLSYFWANDKRTREALGIKKVSNIVGFVISVLVTLLLSEINENQTDQGTVDEWVRCHDGDLPYTEDLKSAIKYHRNLTSRGYRALVYR